MVDLTLLAYPFLFAAIYFEAFLLVTFLSKPARAMRERAVSVNTPSVAMIVPCYNEGTTIKGTVESLLALDYPKELLKIILVNDGSKDNTREVMDSYVGNPQVLVIHKENGGKHTALNAGIEATDAEIVGCLDADSFVERSALREMIGCFDEASVAAATAAMSVHKPGNILERMQNAEYIMGIALRHILASVNGIYVTPGPFSLYRRSVIDELGGFRRGHNTEDMEMALRIQRAGLVIESAPRALVFTKTPKTVPALVKQRVRWTTGFLRNMLYDYRDLVGNPRYGALGTIVLPLGFFAIVGGILMFGIVLYQLGYNLVQMLIVSAGVPLSYTLSNLIPSFSNLTWFYVPLTLFALLSIIALLGSITFIIMGRSISKTPGSLGLGILGWIFLYGLVAPLWLLGSVADVASGHKRSWR